MISWDTKDGREQALKEVAKDSSNRKVKSEELYRITLKISPTSFHTITKKEAEHLKILINKEVEKIKREVVEYGKNNQLSIRMELFLGLDRRLSDVDNLAKCLLDQMQSIVYDNDKIVRHIDILRNRTSQGQITIIIAKYNSQVHGWG